MKIFNVLKNIILENSNRSEKPKLFTTPENVKFFSSKHNTVDREANKSYEEIKDIILNAVDSGSKTHIRVGVPNLMLSRLIRKKYEKILKEFSKNPKEEKIKFVYKREDNEDDEIFDYIEFLIGKEEENNFKVVSSTFSSNGNYLKLFGKDVTQTKKVVLENYFHFRTVFL
jgi:hypothetical protein